MAEKMSIEELGAQFRQNNPEGFAPFTNEEIGRRAIIRDPRLMSRVTPSVVEKNKPDQGVIQGDGS